MPSTRITTLLTTLVFSFAGCVAFDLNGTTCATKADCPSGFECVAARCWEPGKEPADAGSVGDAGVVDAGLPDAGAPDAGTSDAGTSDAGTFDAGTSDAGTFDAGTFDAGVADAGAPDAGMPDAGPPPCTATSCANTDYCKSGVCTPISNCTTGCVDVAKGACLTATSLMAHDTCGVPGVACVACPSTQACFQGRCMDLACAPLPLVNGTTPVPTTQDPSALAPNQGFPVTAYAISTGSQPLETLSTGDLTNDGLDEVAVVHGGVNVRVLLNTDGGLSDCMALGANELGLNAGQPASITRTLLYRQSGAAPQLVYVAGGLAYRLSLQYPLSTPTLACGAFTTVNDVALAAGGTKLVCVTESQFISERLVSGLPAVPAVPLSNGEVVTELSALGTPPAAATQIAYGGSTASLRRETGLLDVSAGLLVTAAPWLSDMLWEGRHVPLQAPNTLLMQSVDTSKNATTVWSCYRGPTAPYPLNCAVTPQEFSPLAGQPMALLPVAAVGNDLTGLGVAGATGGTGQVVRLVGLFSNLAMNSLAPVSDPNMVWRSPAATTGRLTPQGPGEASSVADALLLVNPATANSATPGHLFVLP